MKDEIRKLTGPESDNPVLDPKDDEQKSQRVLSKSHFSFRKID